MRQLVALEQLKCESQMQVESPGSSSKSWTETTERLRTERRQSMRVCFTQKAFSNATRRRFSPGFALHCSTLRVLPAPPVANTYERDDASEVAPGQSRADDIVIKVVISVNNRSSGTLFRK